MGCCNTSPHLPGRSSRLSGQRQLSEATRRNGATWETGRVKCPVAHHTGPHRSECDMSRKWGGFHTAPELHQVVLAAKTLLVP